MRAYRIKSRVRFTIFVTVIIMLLFSLFSFVFNQNNAVGMDLKDQYDEIQAMSGDTLWTIAADYSDNNDDIRKMVNRIYDYNNMTDSDIKEGQYIKIPL